MAIRPPSRSYVVNFALARDACRPIWYSIQPREFGADDVFSITELPSKVREVSGGLSQLFMDSKPDSELHKKVIDAATSANRR